METSDLGNTSLNVREIDSKHSRSEIMTYEEIKDTPFTLVKTDEGWFGSMANHRLTEFYETKAEAKNNTIKISWNRIIQVLAIITEKTKI